MIIKIIVDISILKTYGCILNLKQLTLRRALLLMKLGNFQKNIYPQELTILMIKKFEKKKLRTHIIKTMKIF